MSIFDTYISNLATKKHISFIDSMSCRKLKLFIIFLPHTWQYIFIAKPVKHKPIIQSLYIRDIKTVFFVHLLKSVLQSH